MSDPVTHTPGPWRFKTAGNGDCGISAEGTGVFAEAFAEIRRAGENARAEALANARLISAAPEMLEALRAVVSVADRATVEFDKAHAAILKAEGRSS